LVEKAGSWRQIGFLQKLQAVISGVIPGGIQGSTGAKAGKSQPLLIAHVGVAQPFQRNSCVDPFSTVHNPDPVANPDEDECRP